MAFTSTIMNNSVPNIVGVKKIVTGTFANTAGSTGGDVLTGLRRVESFEMTHTGSAVVASAPVANESFPTATGDITIVTVADTAGVWTAYGE